MAGEGCAGLFCQIPVNLGVFWVRGPLQCLTYKQHSPVTAIILITVEDAFQQE